MAAELCLRREPVPLFGAADSTPVSPEDAPERAAEVVAEVDAATSGWADVAERFGIPRDSIEAMSRAFEGENRDRAKAVTAASSSIDIDLASSRPAGRRDAEWVPAHVRNGRPAGARILAEARLDRFATWRRSRSLHRSNRPRALLREAT